MQGLVRNDLPVNMRGFIFWREKDVSGTSGEGVVAEGIQFSDGKVALRWRTSVASTAFYDSLEDVEEIHGHQGNTQILWLDELNEEEEAPV
jgi:hypothetical protein